MSLTPMERESLAMQPAIAKGHTVIMGLGMGVVLYNVLKQGKATKVTVLERDPEMLDVLQATTDAAATWPNWDRVNFIIGDALEPRDLGYVDVLLIDIWPGLGEESLEADTIRIGPG